MCFRGRENEVVLTRGEDRLSDSVDGLSCLSCVHTKLHMSTRTSVENHRVLMKTLSARFISVLFGPYFRNTDITTDTTCCRVIFLSKLVATQDCVKSNKNRVGIVPHEFISMIHRLVITTHLEDELTCI